MKGHAIWLCAWYFLLLHPVGANELQVKGGQFILEGRLIASQLHIESGTWIRGSGTLEGDLLADGNISPGGPAVDNVGTQRIEGAATFNPGSRFHVYAADHHALDRLVVTGPVAGSCEVVANHAPAAVPVDEIIIRGDAASVFAGFFPSDTWVWQTGSTGTVDLILTHRRGDSDGNGLPDHWEIRNFGMRTGTDPFDDPDDDGYDNLSEYIANTRPNDSNSVMHLTSIMRGNDGTEVAWDTAAGRQYTLLYSTNVVDQPWLWRTSAVMSSYSQPRQVWTTDVDAAHQVYGVRVEEYRP